MRDSRRGVKIVKAVEQTWQCKLRKWAAVEKEEEQDEEEEEVMPERLQTVCLYLLMCVQSVDSLEVKKKLNTQ